MNKRQTIRLNESQFNNLCKRMVTESLKRLMREENGSDYSDLIEWIRDNVEDYVTYDDTKIMPSMRAGFNTDGFINSLVRFLNKRELK